MKNALPISLDGDWNLYSFPEGSLPCSRPADLVHLGIYPVPAAVPGNVELDLVRAGLLADPFWGRNINLLREYERHEWWYVRDFTLPSQSKQAVWDLVFDGLDLLAEVWVNDQKIGAVANMLVPQRFAAGAALRWGEQNRIAFIWLRRSIMPAGWNMNRRI